MPHFKFSANTGYLWKEYPFLERIQLAHKHGFSAVEFHDEAQSADLAELKNVLAETNLPVGGLNTRMASTAGCAAIPEMADQAKQDFDHANTLAVAIGAKAIHVLAGKTTGADAHRTYLQTLRHALSNSDKTILIEPVCQEQLPGYFLQTIDQAAAVLAEINHPQLKIMFDCYHIHRESKDVLHHFQKHAQHIGHVQIAAAENRAEPFAGALDYQTLLPAFQQAGYNGTFGCEYRPATNTTDGLNWRDGFS